jgi:endonuclease/exonuclease/phosphatase family metal-dependent hydrolase
MTVSRSRRTPGVLVGVVLTCGALEGCALAYTMAPAEPDPVCPGAAEAPLLAAQTERSGPLIDWFGPENSGDRDILDTWCQTVGAPVVELDPAEGAGRFAPGDAVLSASDGPGGLTVVVWNVSVGTADVPAFLAAELGHECGPARSGDAGHPFVLLAQEAFRRSARIPDVLPQASVPWRLGPEKRPGEILDVVQVVRECGLSLIYVPSSRNGPQTEGGVREDRGNAILSTLPLDDPTAIELPFEAGRKVAVAATVQGPGGPLRVVSAHLDVASTLLRTLLTGNGTRIRQAQAMADAIDMDAPELPVVAAGDFNTWSERETALQRLELRFPDSPPLDPTPTRTHFPTDHVFFRRAGGANVLVPGSYRRVEERFYSDHHPLIVEIARAHPD